MHMITDSVHPSLVRRGAMIRQGAIVLAASLLVAVCARIQAPLWPVPVTMQIFAVLLVGAALGSRRGAAALVLYLLEGAAGLPVFASPVAGPIYFAGPTAGFLLAFPIAAFVVGFVIERKPARPLVALLGGMAAGQTVILLGGFIRLAPAIGASEAFAVGVAPFLLGDGLKIVLAALAAPTARRIVGRAHRGTANRQATGRP